jgi:hypothetical protein
VGPRDEKACVQKWIERTQISVRWPASGAGAYLCWRPASAWNAAIPLGKQTQRINWTRQWSLFYYRTLLLCRVVERTACSARGNGRQYFAASCLIERRFCSEVYHLMGCDTV